jgi:hypothetical protein
VSLGLAGFAQKLIAALWIILAGILSVNTLRLLSMCCGLFVEWLLSSLQFYGLKYWRLWILCSICGFLISLLLPIYVLITSLPLFVSSSAQSSPLSTLCLSACAWFFVRPSVGASPPLALALESGYDYSSVMSSPAFSKFLVASSPCIAVAGRFFVRYGSRVALACAARVFS